MGCGASARVAPHQPPGAAWAAPAAPASPAAAESPAEVEARFNALGREIHHLRRELATAQRQATVAQQQATAATQRHSTAATAQEPAAAASAAAAAAPLARARTAPSVAAVGASLASGSAAAFHEGVAVEAPWLDAFYHGTVSRVRDDGFLDVDLNIEKRAERVPPSQVWVNEAFERRKADTQQAWCKYQSLQTDDERIAFCEELKFVPVPPEDYEQATGRLGLLILMGAIRFLKGTWLIERARQGLPIDRGQDMPPEAFWEPEELLRCWARSKGRDQQPVLGGVLGPLSLVLIAVSFCWCSQGHADQDLFHLRRIAVLLTAFARFRQQKGSPWKDIAVFWDFPSVYQNPHMPLEVALFSLALYSMQLVYGHDLIFVWKLLAMPPCPQVLDEERRFEAEVHGARRRLAWLYRDRGWPSFESATADARVAVLGSRMEFGDEELTLKNYADTFRFRSRGAAIHPERFERLLAAKTFTHASDAGTVTELYRQTFDVVKRSKTQNFQRTAWTEERMAEYFEALAEMQGLEEFVLESSALGDAGVHRFAEQLAAKRRLHRLVLHEVGLTDAGLGPLLASLPVGLTTLELRNNSIELEAVPEGARLPPNLAALALQANGIGDGGAAWLAGLLPASLAKLLLDRNVVGDPGAQALASALSALPAFENLTLRRNPGITEVGQQALKAALPGAALSF